MSAFKPHLFIVHGVSGSGKTTFTQLIEKNTSIKMVPKYTTRILRSNEADEIITVESLPYHCEYRYTNYSNEYGFSTSDISNIFSSGHHAIVIVGSLKTIDKVKQNYGGLAKVIWIDRDQINLRLLLIERGVTEESIEARCRAVETIRNGFNRNPELFDISISNNKNPQWMIDQFASFLSSCSSNSPKINLDVPHIHEKELPTTHSNLLPK